MNQSRIQLVSQLQRKVKCRLSAITKNTKKKKKIHVQTLWGLNNRGTRANKEQQAGNRDSTRSSIPLTFPFPLLKLLFFSFFVVPFLFNLFFFFNFIFHCTLHFQGLVVWHSKDAPCWNRTPKITLKLLMFSLLSFLY